MAAARAPVRHRHPRRAAALSLEEQAANTATRCGSASPIGCCGIRKVAPLQPELAGVDAWITAIRRDQTPDRAHAAIVVREAVSGPLKINPLATWTTDDVWEFIRANDVPYNPLYDRGYASIGCAPCTTAITHGEHPARDDGAGAKRPSAACTWAPGRCRCSCSPPAVKEHERVPFRSAAWRRVDRSERSRGRGGSVTNAHRRSRCAGWFRGVVHGTVRRRQEHARVGVARSDLGRIGRLKFSMAMRCVRICRRVSDSARTTATPTSGASGSWPGCWRGTACRPSPRRSHPMPR